MTLKTNTTLAILVAALVTGCATGSVPALDASRNDNAALYFHDDPISQGGVDEQAIAMRDASQALMQRSTLNGALIGVAVGCGLSVVSASKASTCLASAAMGGAGSAVMGNIAGKQDVDRRIGLVSPAEVQRTLRNTSNQFASLKSGIPQFLADQVAKMNVLALQLAEGHISLAQHDKEIQHLRRIQNDLAEALSLSARNARLASRNLELATTQGQTGLDWHIQEAGQLANDVMSARSAIQLL